MQSGKLHAIRGVGDDLRNRRDGRVGKVVFAQQRVGGGAKGKRAPGEHKDDCDLMNARRQAVVEAVWAIDRGGRLTSFYEVAILFG